MVLDIAPDRVGDEVADRAAGGDAGTNLGRRESQPRRIEEVDARVDTREVLVEPGATGRREAAAGHDGDATGGEEPLRVTPRRQAAERLGRQDDREIRLAAGLTPQGREPPARIGRG